ncbi:MAG: glycosyltransferase [Candidatus Kapabacteria bacterium]|nr:glycosyltransferase [Candidatus Kapabacteria bacterium]
MDSPDISIIIVNYNVKDFLYQCLKSIFESSHSLKIETIVVDNNSSDGSVDFLEPLFPNVQFIRLKENIGFGKANNIGFEIAKGKYFLLLNPDTVIGEKTLQTMFEFMENHSEVGISGCKVLNPDGTFQLACRRGFPTPWASFCKLFGLQKIFPKSKLFAQYNQTFRSIDETYYIDSIMGAFMFIRREVIEQIGGFNPDYFMYGEDIDLCYRSSKAGWKTAYVHSTSIFHYKGESTKRSSIDEIKHFYEAMEIFARKHYSKFIWFYYLLKVGIYLRSLLAYFNKNIRQFLIIILDLIAINISLMVATKIRFGEFLNFPDYAYPTVFIVISLVLFLSMVLVGEYFESKPTIRRAVFGLMITFFFVSSLTYFFKEYAFSRGVLLMTIGFSVIMSVAFRMFFSIYDKTKGKESERRIAIVGINQQSENLINSLQTIEARNAKIVGLIAVNPEEKTCSLKIPILGNISFLDKILKEHKIKEVIITDQSISNSDLVKIATNVSLPAVRFHLAKEYEELLASRIINEISGYETAIPFYQYKIFRNVLLKRIFDIFISFFLLTIGIPIVYLLFENPRETFNKLWSVFIGKLSFVGLYDNSFSIGKQGIISLVQISNPERLSDETKKNLDRYYLEHYSFYLDIEIILKFITRFK